MEERNTRRCLRNNTNCVPLQNMFKDNQYITRSASQCLPPQILSKIKKFQSLTCDDINSLTFVNNQSHTNAIDRMNQVIELQKAIINNKKIINNQDFRKFSFNAIGGMMMQQKQPRMIKSQEPQNEYKLVGLYEKHNQYPQFGEEILYNQFFRNDLQNLFLQ